MMKESGTKYDNQKPKLALLPAISVVEVGKVFTFGANKYGENNWRGGFKWTRLISACLRHVFAFLRGEDLDEESGLSHIAHAAACLLMLLELYYTRKDLDDRHKYEKEEQVQEK